MTPTDIAAYVRSHMLDPEVVLSKIGIAKMRFFVVGPRHLKDASPPRVVHERMRFEYFPEGHASPTLPPETLTAERLAETIDLFDDLSTAVDAMSASYLSPAIQLNNYLEWSAKDIEWDTIKQSLSNYDGYPSNILRRVSVEAYSHSVLLSVKSGLDRLVSILAYFYSGIAAHTTWGRYDDKGKASGFMAAVARGKDNDALLAKIDLAYHTWIRSAVAPRDVLVHYRDSVSAYHYLSDADVLIQSHVVEDQNGTSHGFGIKTLADYVCAWYELADHVLLVLATQLPRRLRPPRADTSPPSNQPSPRRRGPTKR